MIRRDYIQRLIEQFGQIWAQLIKQLQAGLFPSMRTALDLSYRQLLGIDPERVRVWSSREMLTHMLFGMEPDYGRARVLVLGALLKLEGDLAAQDGDEDGAAIFHQKALDLTLTAHNQQPGADLPIYTPSVDELTRKLKPYTLSADTNRLLVGYYESRGAYADAEDALFDLIDTTTDHDAAVADAVAFYTRLATQSDERLLAGNFSRDEIAAGLAALERDTA